VTTSAAGNKDSNNRQRGHTDMYDREDSSSPIAFNTCDLSGRENHSQPAWNLIGRNVGQSKNTVMAIVQRETAAVS